MNIAVVSAISTGDYALLKAILSELQELQEKYKENQELFQLLKLSERISLSSMYVEKEPYRMEDFDALSVDNQTFAMHFYISEKLLIWDYRIDF